ncbi:Hydrolase-like protein family isoform 4 [Theobroma cacao]|uniref:Hydrolase-like protein family isoform 4 n=1 Tax=Theobroma cacao TaxID=3641 RepID=A0A061GLP1_THECC|nr:Hydrolase-like protein family isoform 4 [Theobroma cacao]
MAMASLIQAGCGYSPIFSNNSNNCSFRTGSFGPFGCSSPSSSCTCSSSSHNLDFRSGTNNNWKHQGHRAQAMSTAPQGNFASSKSISNGKNEPDHLLVLVHGILASPSDWTYVEAELKRRLGRNFLIYASSCNTYTKTLTGVDGAGKRLADEVLQVVKKTESLKKISFLAHSLGGLFARYAVAVLYTENDSSGTQSDKVTDSSEGNLQTSRPSRRGTIAGLEAVSFITLATPHLGVRGRKQIWLAGAHPPSGGRKNLLSPHYDLWMVTNMLWMWTTVHQFLLMAPVFLPKLPKQRRQHRMHLTYKTQSNIMNSWKRK